MDFITCLSCVEKHKNKVSEENRILKEQILELQKDNHNYSLKNIDLKRQIAMLQDGLEYHKDMADSYAKVLKKIYDLIEEFQAYFPDMDEFLLQREFFNKDIDLSILTELKNSIPETALRRI